MLRPKSDKDFSAARMTLGTASPEREAILLTKEQIKCPGIETTETT
jgi:hypothetical protein